jgi:hypothetical protein
MAIKNWYKIYGTKTHLHQRKLNNYLLKRSVRNIGSKLNGRNYKSFEMLYKDIESSLQPSCWKNGYLAYYDATLRIGASMSVSPRKFLYIHAGTRKGLLKLKLSQTVPTNCIRIPMNALPKPMQKLGSVHAENFLCFVHIGKF